MLRQEPFFRISGASIPRSRFERPAPEVPASPPELEPATPIEIPQTPGEPQPDTTPEIPPPLPEAPPAPAPEIP